MLLDPGTAQALSTQAHIPTREDIERLEARTRTMAQLPVVSLHHISNGLRARESAMRAGTVMAGEVEQTERLSILLKGRLAMWVGESMSIVSAPYTMVSVPGTKRAAFVLDDAVWTEVHINAGAEI